MPLVSELSCLLGSEACRAPWESKSGPRVPACHDGKEGCLLQAREPEMIGVPGTEYTSRWLQSSLPGPHPQWPVTYSHRVTSPGRSSQTALWDSPDAIADSSLIFIPICEVQPGWPSHRWPWPAAPQVSPQLPHRTAPAPALSTTFECLISIPSPLSRLPFL